MSINCNNSDNHRINKLQVQDGKNSVTIDLNNLEGINVKSSASLFEYLKKNKVNVDADDNGIVDKQEAKVLRQALSELAGENGVIDSKDFKKDIDSDKESRKSAFNSAKYLRGPGTIKYNDDGSFVKTIGYRNQTIISYDKDGNEVGGEINNEKFTTKVQEDGKFSRTLACGEVRNYSEKGVETGGKSPNNEIFYTTINGNEVTRKYKASNDIRIYDSDSNQIGGIKDGKSYKVVNFIDNSYRYVYNDKDSDVEVFDSEGNWLGAVDKDNPNISWPAQHAATYTIKYDGDGGYIKTYPDKSAEHFDKNGNISGGTDKDGVSFTIKTNDDKSYSKNYLDGSVEDFDVNGRLQSGKNKKGISFEVKYEADGSFNKTFADGNYEKYGADGKTISGKRQNLEYTVEYANDGSYVEKFSDNSTQSFDKDGKLTHISRGGQEYDVKNENGNKIIYNKNCVYKYDSQNRIIEQRTKDESYTVEYDSEGNALYKYSDGSNVTYNKDGKIIKNNGANVELEDAEMNGKLDAKFIQGDVGDCWLLSGMASVISKPGGKEYLESLIKYDSQIGNAQVRLPGAGRTYTITKSDMDKYGYLSGGDRDVRLFEIAMEKYLKSQGQSAGEHGSRIDGNQMTTFYNAIYPGKRSKETDVSPGKQFDVNKFNDSKTAFTIYTTKKGFNAIAPDGKIYELSTEHGYSVLKTEGAYVYLNDPNVAFDPSNPEANAYKVKVEDFNKYCNCVQSVSMS